MNEHLSIQGTLAETTVPDLFRSLIRSGETAIASLEAIGRHDNIFFDRGKIIFATSSDPDLALGEVLLRSGQLNLQQYTDATESVMSPRRIGAVLCERGYLEPEELIRAEERQVREIVLNVLCYRTGSYTISFTSEFPKEIVTLSINTDRLVMDGIRQIGYWSLIARGIGRMNRLLQHTAGADARMYHLDLQEDESHVYSLLSQPQTLESLCARSYLSNFMTCRTLLELLTVNLVEEGESTELDLQRAVSLSELELEEMVERYNAAFQSLFALVFQEVGDYVWDFVDRVVSHLSSEQLPYLNGINIANEGRVDFDQLLNNLISSGSSQHRETVRALLDQLLSGWVVESRTEFGSRLESQVEQIVEPMRRDS